VTPGASIELASRLLGRTCSLERPITVDQTNESVVVDESVVVKWLRPPVPAPHPGVDLMRHLATAGFDEMPALVGVEERRGTVRAIVTEFLVGGRDGWDWYVDDVELWLHGEAAFDDLVASARQLGEITARLHIALSDMQPATTDLTGVGREAMDDLQLALDRLDHLDWLSESTVERALRPLHCHSAAHRVHGDLHVGQFLRSGDRVVVTDFDGNPLQNSVMRSQPQSPLRDLASMMQSIVHVGTVVVKRRCPDRQDDVERFIDAATTAALDAYTSVHETDLEVLHAFRVAQELHEYAYSIHHLPHWRYVADAALPDLLARIT
jgi:maltokinase